MDWMGPAIAAAGNLWSSASNNSANASIADNANRFNEKMWERQATFNAQSAETAYNYNSYMSGTAYQRAVADMKAAGLNPMLAYNQGGASTPQGSAPNAPPATGAATPTYRNGVGPAITSALQVDQQLENINLIKRQADVAEAQARKTNAEAITELGRPENVAADTQSKRGQYSVSETQQKLNVSSAALADQQTRNLQVEMEKTFHAIDLLKQQTGNAKLQAEAIRAGTDLHLAQTAYEHGRISIQQYTKQIEAARAMIENNAVEGSAQESKFQSGFGQIQRIIKTFNPLSGLAK